MTSVLVVDDDRDLCSLLRESLESRGLEVFLAADGSEADRILSERAIDIAIIDGLLPGESGVDFIARMRARGSTLLIAFVSTHFRDLRNPEPPHDEALCLDRCLQAA